MLRFAITASTEAVEAHGGLIWAEDIEEGAGTAFWIVLPGPRRASGSGERATAPSASLRT